MFQKGLLFCEHVNRCRNEYSKYTPSMSDKIFVDRFCDMSKYILTKEYSNMLAQIDTSSLTHESTMET
jgi:hypothetical protein